MGFYFLLPLPLMFIAVAWWASEQGRPWMAVIAAVLGIAALIWVTSSINAL